MTYRTNSWEHTQILNTLRRCTRCTMPETHETIAFDEEGVCNICRQHEYKKEKIDWDKRKQDLLALADRFRGKHAYDVIVPFSGGKDSAFTAWYAVRELGLKTLIVSFDHGFYRPRVLENNERVLRALGADFLKFRSDWKIVRKLMLESLKRKGDFDWHAHTGTFAYPMQIAARYQVPFLLWGEQSAEYTAYYSYEDEELVDERRFHRFTTLFKGPSATNIFCTHNPSKISHLIIAGPYTNVLLRYYRSNQSSQLPGPLKY